MFSFFYGKFSLCNFVNFKFRFCFCFFCFVFRDRKLISLYGLELAMWTRLAWDSAQSACLFLSP